MANVYKQSQAKQDLIDVWLYTFEEWGEVQADRYLDELDLRLTRLLEQPLMCRERTEFTPPVRIYHFKHHLVIYTIIDDGVSIIRVLHKSMELNAQLDE